MEPNIEEFGSKKLTPMNHHHWLLQDSSHRKSMILSVPNIKTLGNETEEFTIHIYDNPSGPKSEDKSFQCELRNGQITIFETKINGTAFSKKPLDIGSLVRGTNRYAFKEMGESWSPFSGPQIQTQPSQIQIQPSTKNSSVTETKTISNEARACPPCNPPPCKPCPENQPQSCQPCSKNWMYGTIILGIIALLLAAWIVKNLLSKPNGNTNTNTNNNNNGNNNNSTSKYGNSSSKYSSANNKRDGIGNNKYDGIAKDRLDKSPTPLYKVP